MGLCAFLSFGTTLVVHEAAPHSVHQWAELTGSPGLSRYLRNQNSSGSPAGVESTAGNVSNCGPRCLGATRFTRPTSFLSGNSWRSTPVDHDCLPEEGTNGSLGRDRCSTKRARVPAGPDPSRGSGPDRRSRMACPVGEKPAAGGFRDRHRRRSVAGVVHGVAGGGPHRPRARGGGPCYTR